MTSEELKLTLRLVPYGFGAAYIGLLVGLSFAPVVLWSLGIASVLGLSSFAILSKVARSSQSTMTILGCIDLALVMLAWRFVVEVAEYSSFAHHVQFFCTWIVVETGLVLLLKHKLKVSPSPNAQ